MPEPGSPQFTDKEGLIGQLQNDLVAALKSNNFRSLQFSIEDISRMSSGAVTPDEIFTSDFSERIAQEGELGLTDMLTTETMGERQVPITFKQACEYWKIPNDAITHIVTRAARQLTLDTLNWGSDECKENAKKLLAEYGIPEDALLQTER